MNRLSIKELNALPKDIVTEIKNTLRAYDRCTVKYMYGEYSVSTSSCLLAEYPSDYKVVGDVFKEDIFTDKEKIENYINTFKSYPAEYEGDRDYKMLKEMKETVEGDILYQTFGEINDLGNFEIIGVREINI